MSLRLSGLAIMYLFLPGCSGSTDSVPDVALQATTPSAIKLQAIRIDTYNGFNKVRNDLIDNSFNMLSKVESMLKRMNDSRDVYVDVMTSLTQPFGLTTAEPLTLNAGVNSTTPPFTIGIGGLNNDFLLLSSSSRFLTPGNSLKSRFKTSAELSTAWLRAVEFSDQLCVYVKLQSVDTVGNVSTASHTLVVPLVSPAQCAVQL